jgi:CRISPR-associated exonuclease Cas4
MYCLDIPQHEEKRYKVVRGRDIHEIKKKSGKDYIRKRLNCIRKESSVYLASREHYIKGIVDEVLFLEDGTAAPFEYKFAEYKDRIFKTYKTQLILHALMIKETYNIEVNRGYLCYTRSNNLVKEIWFRNRDFENAISILNNIIEIIQKGFYPKKTRYLKRCIDCCYRNICV